MWANAIPAVNGMSSPKAAADTTPGLGAGKGRNIEFVPLDGASKSAPRLVTGVADSIASRAGWYPGRPFWWAVIPASANRRSFSRWPTISKSAATSRARSGRPGPDADRLGLAEASVQLAAATNVRDIVATLDIADPPRLVIIDSIQTMYLDSLESAPGSVSQYEAADTLIRLAKRRVSADLVGHVTSTIAGPRVLEHMVDTFFTEGERVTSSACYGRQEPVRTTTRSASSR